MFVVRLMLGIAGATVSVRTFTWLSCLNVHYCLWSCDLFTLLAFKERKKERNMGRPFWSCFLLPSPISRVPVIFGPGGITPKAVLSIQMRHWHCYWLRTRGGSVLSVGVCTLAAFIVQRSSSIVAASSVVFRDWTRCVMTTRPMCMLVRL